MGKEYAVRLTPALSRPDRVERICEKMQERGYDLTEVGTYLLHFKKSETGERFVYRAELKAEKSRRSSGEETSFDADYENALWTAVDSSDAFAVYCAVEGTKPPEIASERRAAISKKRLVGVSVPAALLLVMTLLLFSPMIFELHGKLADVMLIKLITDRGLLLMPAVGLLLAAWVLIGLARLYAANRRGERSANSALPMPCALLAMLLLAELLSVFSIFNMLPNWRDLPESANAKPYLVMSELGIEAERKRSLLGDTSSIKESGLLFAHCFDTNEYTDRGWLFQDVYELRSPRLAKKLFLALLNTEHSGFGEEHYPLVETALFDECRRLGENEFLFIKGSRVAKLSLHLFDGEQMPEEAIFRALSEKWERG